MYYKITLNLSIKDLAYSFNKDYWPGLHTVRFHILHSLQRECCVFNTILTKITIIFKGCKMIVNK
jgi:hypothetical protein